MQKPKKIKLKNGLTVLFTHLPDSATTTVAVFVRAGSEYETKRIGGISHFLEHMCFQGTKTRPTNKDIAHEMESLGASYNAFTSNEHTGFHAKVANRDFAQAADIVFDIYLNSIFNPQVIEKEKNVIIEEMNMREDDPQIKTWDVFQELMYGDTPAGRKVIGTKESVRGITRNELVKYHAENYLPNRTVVSVAGGVPFADVKKYVVSSFGHLRPGRDLTKKKTGDPQRSFREQVFFRDSKQTHFLLGFRAFSFFDPRRYSLHFLTSALGVGMGSRLWIRIREELGAAYYIYATNDLSSDHGFFTIAGGVDHAKLPRVLSAAKEEFIDIAEHGISEEELARVKKQIISRKLISNETSDDWAFYYGGQEILRDTLETPADVIRAYEHITARDVKRVARDIFRNGKMNLAVLGPFKNRKFGDIVKL